MLLRPYLRSEASLETPTSTIKYRALFLIENIDRFSTVRNGGGEESKADAKDTKSDPKISLSAFLNMVDGVVKRGSYSHKYNKRSLAAG
jgi:hypothetical protein